MVVELGQLPVHIRDCVCQFDPRGLAQAGSSFET